MRRVVRHELKFGEGCDLEGTLNLAADRFPVDLKVRNLRNAERIKAIVIPQVTPDILDNRVTVDVRAEKGMLLEKLDRPYFEFTGNYAVVAGLNGKLRENRGGKVALQKFKGKPAQGEVPVIW